MAKANDRSYFAAETQGVNGNQWKSMDIGFVLSSFKHLFKATALVSRWP